MTFRRFASLLVLVPVAALILVFAVANRRPVLLSFDPFNVDAPAFSLSAPLFLVLFAVLMIGVVLGGAASWLRQGRHRRAAREAREQVQRYEAELSRLRDQKPTLPAPLSSPF
ncbi:MAG: lipopolysaccharide assembly protein LapA domain-containing protein [Labrys sp. (in: a-proteobacteria)]|jgi:uncharacterized integral membrane protein